MNCHKTLRPHPQLEHLTHTTMQENKFKSEKSRRYYIHTQVKKFALVKATLRQVNVTETLMQNLTVRQRGYLDELLKYGYNLQYGIE